MARVYVERSLDVVVGVYCSLGCAETRKGEGAPGCTAESFPRPNRGIGAYALRLLTCDECGDNVRDVIDEQTS